MREIKKQAVKFWHSPWAYHSAWENGHGVRARFHLEDAQLVVEVEAPLGIQRARARTTDTEMRLDLGEERVLVPLPSPVEPGLEEDLDFSTGAATLTLPRLGLEDQLKS